jgi:hypothetical protein
VVATVADAALTIRHTVKNTNKLFNFIFSLLKNFFFDLNYIKLTQQLVTVNTGYECIRVTHPASIYPVFPNLTSIYYILKDVTSKTISRGKKNDFAQKALTIRKHPFLPYITGNPHNCLLTSHKMVIRQVR